MMDNVSTFPSYSANFTWIYIYLGRWSYWKRGIVLGIVFQRFTTSRWCCGGTGELTVWSTASLRVIVIQAALLWEQPWVHTVSPLFLQREVLVFLDQEALQFYITVLRRARYILCFCNWVTLVTSIPQEIKHTIASQILACKSKMSWMHVKERIGQKLHACSCKLP